MNRCKLVRRTLRHVTTSTRIQVCHQSRTHALGPLRSTELAETLSTPSWSIQSLLDGRSKSATIASVTPKQLHHLLRLSALPLPKTQEEETKMIKTLESQLHFVQAIQGVDTTSIEPLQSIRDETHEAEMENEISLQTLKEDLEKEVIVGMSRRIRSRQGVSTEEDEDTAGWDSLALASKKSGRYIVVEIGKG